MVCNAKRNTAAVPAPGIYIGPNGTIVSPDGHILGADGHPVPHGFKLSKDNTAILDPSGSPITDKYTLGPNGCLIGANGKLYPAKHHEAQKVKALPDNFKLGPIGNLLLDGVPVLKGSRFTYAGTLLGPDASLVWSPPV